LPETLTQGDRPDPGRAWRRARTLPTEDQLPAEAGRLAPTLPAKTARRLSEFRSRSRCNGFFNCLSLCKTVMATHKSIEPVTRHGFKPGCQEHHPAAIALRPRPSGLRPTVIQLRGHPDGGSARCRAGAARACRRSSGGRVAKRLRTGCVKKVRKRHAVREMKEGPSEPPCRRRLQTAMSCFDRKVTVVNVMVKRRG
jgi:hypothetical protein